MEDVSSIYQVRPRNYYDDGNTIPYGFPLGQLPSDQMRLGEIFTVLTEDGKAFSKVWMNSFGEIQEELLNQPEWK